MHASTIVLTFLITYQLNLEIICLQKYWLRPVDLTPFTLLTGCDKFIYSGMKDGDVHLVDRPFGGLVVLQSRLLSILLWTMATVLITGYRVSLSNISERNLFFLMCIYHCLGAKDIMITMLILLMLLC